MKQRTARRRGQPLTVLAVVFALWIGARIVLWQSPFPAIFTPDDLPIQAAHSASRAPKGTSMDLPLLSRINQIVEAAPHKSSLAVRIPEQQVVPRRPVVDAAFLAPQVAASHQLLFMAAMAYVPVPAELAPYFTDRDGGGSGATPPARREPPGSKRIKRWSFDGWLYLRPDGRTPSSAGPFPSTYGASQAGAVMRYQLAPQNRHQPKAYVRVTKALAGAQEGDIAGGVSARPIGRAPVSVQLEARLSRVNGASEIRPAALAVTELEPRELPLGVRGEVYAQAGYVGGNFATGFVDGQARVDRQFAEIGGAKLRAGAGLWGGAQKGAARLDVGPSVNVFLGPDQAPVRLSVDYRHRIAGNAMPQSGFALTLSTGF